jgi:hypothetical protein
MTMADRGVNEVIGFVLVFSLITATVGVVSVVGFNGLQETRNAERIGNAERAFDVLADNVADIYYEDAPTRATEIKLADAQLFLAPKTTSAPSPTKFRVTVDNPGNSNDVETKRFPRPLVYQSKTDSDSRVVYDAGATFRVDGDSAVMLREPPLVLRENSQSIITLVNVGGSPGSSVGGTTTALVRSEELESETTYPTGSVGPSVSGEVTIAIQTTEARAEAWERYLEEEISWESDACSVSSGTVDCTFETDKLYVNVVAIEFELSA